MSTVKGFDPIRDGVEWSLFFACQKIASNVRVTVAGGKTEVVFEDSSGNDIEGCEFRLRFPFFAPGEYRFAVVPGGTDPGPGAPGASALAAAAPIDNFTFVSEDVLGNPGGGYRARNLPPVAVNEFISILSDSRDGYVRFAALLDDDTTVTGTKFGDRIEVGAGDDTVTGGDGGDIVFKWKAGDLTFDGGAGIDILSFGTDLGTAFPEPFVEMLDIDLLAGTGRNPYGGAIAVTSVEAIFDTSQRDRILGSNASDTLVSDRGGRDIVRLRGGDDEVQLLNPTKGAFYDGGGGSDRFEVSLFSSSIFDQSNQSANRGDLRGVDSVNFEEFRFSMPFTGAGTFVFRGGSGDEAVDFFGGLSPGFISTATLTLGAGDDSANGSNGNDTLSGGDGMDSLDGRAGNDRLIGGAERDRLDGGVDDDVLVGGTGADFFVFVDIFGNAWGIDRVTDFEDGRDKLDFRGHSGVNGLGDLVIVQSGTTAVVRHGTDKVLLLDTDIADLGAADFLF